MPDPDPRSASLGASSRAGIVAIIGVPNAGKSTLINQFVGSKIAIVTPKAQTTRSRVTGITVVGETQIVFIDTPGIFQPRRRLDRAMVGAAWKSAADADRILVLIDAERGLGADVERLLSEFANLGRLAILVLNKVDKVNKPNLLGLASALNERFTFEATFMISALTGDGIDALRAYLACHLPEGPWLYPEDQLADIPERLLAAEITREKLFLRLREELPYASTVETENWNDEPDSSLRIDQVIYVARESQKPIVLGKGGQTIKAIGSAARREMESIFDRRVHLFLFVKVRAGWLDDPERYREMGLDFPQEG